MKDVILVSPEMTTFVGTGPIPEAPLPACPVVFGFEGFREPAPCALHYRAGLELAGLESTPLVFVVSREACQRLFEIQLPSSQTWHLPHALRELAVSIIECEAQSEARYTLRLARSIELLCQVHAALEMGTLIPVAAENRLSEFDIDRIVFARRILDQRWQEKLTVSELARLVGVNRDKLMKGFREVFGATIAEVLAERRLAEARGLLLSSDLPVASVAYRCSYLNNASFTRAFTRRFGVAPTELRRTGVAA